MLGAAQFDPLCAQRLKRKPRQAKHSLRDIALPFELLAAPVADLEGRNLPLGPIQATVADEMLCSSQIEIEPQIGAFEEGQPRSAGALLRLCQALCFGIAGPLLP